MTITTITVPERQLPFTLWHLQCRIQLRYDSSQYNYGVTGGVVIHPHGGRSRNIWATLLRLSMLMGLLREDTKLSGDCY